jgi:DNA primase
VVTAAASTVTPQAIPDKATVQPTQPPAAEEAGGGIDYAALRNQISMEQVLAHLGCLTRLKGSGVQRRGPCPIHAPADTRLRCFSVNLEKKVFHCFHPPCDAHGNVLDLWAAVRRLPLYEAARDLAATLQVPLVFLSGTGKRNP